MYAAVVTFGIDKLGVKRAVPLIIFVEVALEFARKHCDCRIVALKTVPFYIEIELEIVASLLSGQTCKNVAELGIPIVCVIKSVD